MAFRVSPIVHTRTIPRSPRLQFARPTLATVRVQNGRPVRGKLQVVSVTGGLLCLTSLLEQGSVVKLMFLTDTGMVLGTAEMLASLSGTLQPFRFVRIDEDHEHRLRDLIQSSVEQKRSEQVSILRDRAW
jgi:hypothetical protein